MSTRIGNHPLEPADRGSGDPRQRHRRADLRGEVARLDRRQCKPPTNQHSRSLTRVHSYKPREDPGEELHHCDLTLAPFAWGPGGVSKERQPDSLLNAHIPIVTRNDRDPPKRIPSRSPVGGFPYRVL
jgi:hypothetical protein